MVASRILAATLVASGLSHASSDDQLQAVSSDFGPSFEVAKSRGPQIFNAVHDTMRQWGESLHHNGMSFFLATVPEGVILHHGNNNERSPVDPDWLAYEIEHAESFARGGRGPPGGPGGPGGPGHGGPPGSAPPPRPDSELGQIVLGDYGTIAEPLLHEQEDHEPPEEAKGGWLHTYRSTRPLRYLYVDGMSGGKTTMGTLDSQDYLLRGNRAVYGFDKPAKTEGKAHQKRTGGPMDEQARAVELCALCKDWGLSGVIRMEAGFEIIQCDFHDGFEQVQALQRPGSTGNGGQGRPRGVSSFERVRGLAERYQDIGASRTIIDYSSMVSAFFFPVNLTNPDPKRQDLPRLSNTTHAELAAIQGYLNQTIAARIHDPIRNIDWRDVTDLIVGRYADRIKYMVEKATSPSQLVDETNFLLTVYIDYSGKDSAADQVPAAIERCSTFYLHGVKPATEADKLIHAAVKAVTTEICTKLFAVREIASGDSASASDADKMAEAVAVLTTLMEDLAWARFKRCPPCDIDEVCLIPMWPMGSKADYDSPRCVNSSNMDGGGGDNYWGGFGPGRPGGGRGGRDGPPPQS